MNKYETIFLMKDDLTKEQREKIINIIREYLNKNGKITSESEIGLRTLAYDIRKYKQAYYFLFEFESEPIIIQELQRTYRITEDILKFIVVKK